MHMISDPSAVVDMIYLDFAKAFDKVDHGILLRKLREIGISGNLGIWFYNFLAHRSQCDNMFDCQVVLAMIAW